MKSKVSGAWRSKALVNGVARLLPGASRRVATGVLAAALLTSCGGGQQVSQFHATRVIAFGDETSVINADQSKYSVNAVAANGGFDCLANPLWIQTVAGLYGLTFPQCPGAATVSPVSRIFAANGAVVADLAGQIDQQLGSGGFAAGDLVTVLVGANDIIAQYLQYPGVGEAQLATNLDTAGAALATQVNRLAGLGAKVLISTVPNMGLTPFAGSRPVGSTNPNSALLSRLSARFNDALLARLNNDGRSIGLIQLDEFLQANDRATTQFGQGTYANTTLPACTVALPRCTTATQVAAATTTVWLWADDRHFGATGQSNLGSLAATRAQNNPF